MSLIWFKDSMEKVRFCASLEISQYGSDMTPKTWKEYCSLMSIIQIILVAGEGTVVPVKWPCLDFDYKQTNICVYPYLIKKVHRSAATGLQTTL
jgi:hypothetical protein